MATGMCAAGGGRRRGLRVLAEALQQLELPTEVVVVVARGEVLVQPLASQLRIKRIDEDGGPCAHRRAHASPNERFCAWNLIYIFSASGIKGM